MRRVELLSIELENFRSFRDRALFELSPTSGLKFISGDNQAQPRLGANGAGKSTLWDALSFCISNASVKGTRPSDLVSWGAKQSIVTTKWLIDGEAFAISRQSNPNKLTLDDEPVEQATIDQILGMTRKRFLQSIIFGQGVPLFVDLAVPERGALLDEVLDLGIWLKLSEHAGADHALQTRFLNETKSTIAHLEGKIEGLQSTETIKLEWAAWEEARDRRLDQAIAAVETAENELQALETKVGATKKAADMLVDLRAQWNIITAKQQQKVTLEGEYKRLFEKLTEAEELRKFYAHNRTCPTCSQAILPHISEKRQQEAVTRYNSFKREIQSNGQVTNQLTTELQELEASYQKESRKRDFLLEQYTTARANFTNRERTLEGAVAAVEAVAGALNPYIAQLAAAAADLAAAQDEMRKAQAAVRRLQGAAIRADFWKAAFKRVRLFLVKRVLQQLEVETAAAAIALGLTGWTIAFSTELETKSGTTRPGIFINVTSPNATAPWEAWSGGEAQRIRLAVAIGMSSMIQRLAGISFGVEVWDEPSAWLSPEGIEDLLDCLRHRAETTGKALYLCDHRAIIYSGFSEIWSVIKSSAGSSISLLSTAEG